LGTGCEVRPDGDGVDLIAFLDESIKAKDAEIQRLRDARAALFGESLTPVAEMTEVTVEFERIPTNHDREHTWIFGNHYKLPILKPDTTAHFTVTMRYPMGSELRKDDK